MLAFYAETNISILQKIKKIVILNISTLIYVLQQKQNFMTVDNNAYVVM